MRLTKKRFGVVPAAALAISGAIVGLGSYGSEGFGEAVAATSAQKAEFQPIDLIDDDHIDASCRYVVDELLQRRPIH